MSYQVIARKWRPQTFDEVTGQETITQTLRNALEYDRLHHAYLFSGARGVGKTTTARLLAKALNCHKTEKPNITPCRTDASDACPSCIEISESRSMDVLEIDAASHTGVDDIRDTILEGINIRPARDRFKVFIIDEVHMLSRSSFNALLKTLEEPPDSVVFIMATTELHKVPETILSRCQEFEFRTIPLQKIFDRVKLIAEAEKIAISDEALKEIARSGEGSMRDAQSNFDQIISFSGENIDVADVTKALGLAGSEMLTRVLQAISERQPKIALMVVSELTSRGQDLRNFCRDLLGLFRDLLVFKVSGGDPTLAESAALTPDELAEQAGLFTESDLVRFFNSLAETETKLREATQARYVVEVGLVKLIEMRSVTAVETLLQRLAALEADDGTRTSVRPEATELRTEVRVPSAVPEKKTLTEAPPPEEPEFFDPRAPVERASAGVGTFPEPAARTEDVLESTAADHKALAKPAYDLSFLDSIDLPLPAIDSEDLVHVDDDWLDNTLDQRLIESGDDLKPIPNAGNLLAAAIGKKPQSRTPASNGNANGSSAATAPALEIAPFIPPVFELEPDMEPLTLSAEPTTEELFAYAKSDRLVRTAMRIFRGTIKEVRKR
jgi:DNA polymerase-3 subunit gamma/tau